MAKIQFADTVNIEQLAAMIPVMSATAEGVDDHVTPVIVSEPGVGKTSILKLIAEKNGDKWRKAGDNYPTDKYDYIYVDCPSKDFMDIAGTIPNHAEKSLEQYVGSLFKLDSDKPKVIMLDEVFKVPKLMGVLFTRLQLERMVGDRPLPFGSIVFATSNNTSDGVGDSMQAHQGNRVCIMRMEKPDARRWNKWAGENGISSTIRAFVAMNPRVLNSYMDGGQENNEFIFNPTKPSQMVSFISPRSLTKCNRIVKNRNVWGKAAADVALAGTIGLSGAKLLSVFIDMEAQVIPVADVIANPMGVTVPEDVAALCMLMINAVDEIKTQDDLSSFMQFVQRMKQSELQSVFFTMLLDNSRTTKLAANNDVVKGWAMTNYKFL
jgi:ATPase family associated with various cellular activities (AAA)